jgi:superfamily II DNA helicase RecQ
MLDYIVFLSCLEFAVLNSFYDEIVFKPKQVVCLESMYLQNDVMCVLPTGYGKSLVFHLLPMLLFVRGRICSWKSKDIAATTVSSIVMVVSPLNSLISDQVARLYASGIRASVIDVITRQHQSNVDSEENIEHDVDFRLCDAAKLRAGHYHLVFAHPESLISTKYGRELLLSKNYQENVVAIVIDEAHCILDW